MRFTQSPECLDFRYVPPCPNHLWYLDEISFPFLFFLLLKIEHRALCISSKQSTTELYPWDGLLYLKPRNKTEVSVKLAESATFSSTGHKQEKVGVQKEKP